MATTSNGEGGASERTTNRWQWSSGLIGILIVGVATASGLLVSRTKADFGAFLALVLAALAGGCFAGILVGGPGLESGDDAAQKANERGWADRLGVFGNWVTGAGFVLVVANAAEIAGWFSSVTRSVADRNGGHGDTLYQYALGSWMIAAVSLGFAMGFMQMVTTGRRLIRAAAKAEAAADAAKTAAKQANAAAAAAGVAAQAAAARTMS